MPNRSPRPSRMTSPGYGFESASSPPGERFPWSRVEDVLAIHPEKALFLSEGRQHYFGDLSGFLAAADPREVKLPAREAVAAFRRARPASRAGGAPLGGPGPGA